MSASQVRTAYRQLLKVQHKRFAGDAPVVLAAKEKTREEFESNRAVTDGKKIKKLLKHAADVELVIRSYVVQAPRNTDKNNTYNIKFTSEHALRDRHPIIIKSSLQGKDSKNEESK
ncbi:Complex III assembly factor lyrm7 [Coemansia sp. RSA 1813]|nr:Complex III assembly factor lyrm7 [Coemansia sp. RSA 1843]KAJ2087877.1 Complex III assembly factor lyrm7 [Coemansia sp. RSA 986]KAJ2567509.1 Complex III assembly factor lyrm7 [Coemansia sp. RSA 1813]